MINGKAKVGVSKKHPLFRKLTFALSSFVSISLKKKKCTGTNEICSEKVMLPHLNLMNTPFVPVPRFLLSLFFVLMFFGLASFVSAITLDDTYSIWKLDEGFGNVVIDSSGNNRNGTTINSPLWVEGKYETALSFDGINQYINFGDIANFERTKSFSVEAWVNLSAKGVIISRNQWVSPYRGWFVATNPSGWLQFILTNTWGSNQLLVYQDEVLMNDNEWHHIIITYDGSSNNVGVKFYVDGELRTIKGNPSTLSATIQVAKDTQICGADTINELFTGMIDEIYIYNRTLTQDEVTYRYNYLESEVFVNRIAQNPDNITTFNLMERGLNITFNITSALGIVLDSVTLFYETNTTESDYFKFIDGVSYFGFQKKNELLSNTSSNYTFELDNNDIYPATYNFEEKLMKVYPKLNLSLLSNDLLKVRLFNVSNNVNYSFLEFYVDNSSVTSEVLLVTYCNSSYTSGLLSLSSNCIQFGSILPSTAYNHSHGINQKHFAIPFLINTTSHTLGNVFVTNTSYFILSGKNWKAKYINNISRIDTVQLSLNKGLSYNNFTGSIDLHLHQFDNVISYKYACANNTLNVIGCSVVYFDSISEVPLPPITPNVYSPIGIEYEKGSLIAINYTSSYASNGKYISFYNISLLNEDYTFNKTIISNNNLYLSYILNTSNIPFGLYRIQVEACDNSGLCSSSYSSNFSLTNLPPLIILYSPSNQTYLSTNISLSYYIYDANLSSIWYNLNGGDNITLNESINYIIANLGDNIFNIYANDSYNYLSYITVSFNVNPYANISLFCYFENYPSKKLKLRGMNDFDIFCYSLEAYLNEECNVLVYKDETLINSNNEVIVKDYGIINKFKFKNNLLHARFSISYLTPDVIFNLKLVCSDDGGDFTFETPFEISYKDLGKIGTRSLWVKKNAGYLLGLLIVICAGLFIYKVIRK